MLKDAQTHLEYSPLINTTHVQSVRIEINIVQRELRLDNFRAAEEPQRATEQRILRVVKSRHVQQAFLFVKRHRVKLIPGGLHQKALLVARQATGHYEPLWKH